MIGSVKRSLRKILGNAKLTYDELLTNLIEIEGTINSRPLTYDYNEVDVEVLTPSHLIFGYRLQSMPDDVVRVNDDDVDEVEGHRKRYRFLTRLRDHFWTRWRREYLTDLREYHKGKERRVDVVVELGDVVLVFDEKLKRGFWKLAVVERLITGKDGVVRGATVRLSEKGKSKCLNRPVQRLYPLEIRSDKSDASDVETQFCENSDQPQRPRRAAALDSKRKTQAMLEP